MSATTTEQPQTPAPAQPTAETPKASPDEAKFTQAQLDAILKDRLDQERRQREKAETKAREDAEAKALLEQAKYQELAEQRAKRITELEAQANEVETAQSQAERYKTALGKHLDTQRANLPAHITALLDKLDPVDQLEWIAANQDAITPQRNGSGGIPPSPRGQSAPLPSREQLIAEEKAKRRAQYGGL